MIQNTVEDDKVIHELQLRWQDEVPQYRIFEIGSISPLDDSTIVAFYLVKVHKYGVILNFNGLIEYFEYDNDRLNWRERIGKPEGELRQDLFYSRLF